MEGLVGKCCFAWSKFFTNSRRFTVNKSRTVYCFPLYHVIMLSWNLPPHVYDWKNPAAVRAPLLISYHLWKKIRIEKQLYSPCLGPWQRLFVFPSPLLKQGFGFLHLSSALPHHSLLRLGWVSVRNPPRFPANPHKSICYFPSPLLPILYSFNSLSLSISVSFLHLSSFRTHNPADLWTYSD